MWALLMLALCSSLQSIAVGDAQLQRQPVDASPLLPACKNTEEYQQCGCLKTCCNRGKPEGCAAQCTSGCFCKDGLVKNKNGDCIPLKDCNKTGPPTPTCGPNEEHYGCIPTCRNTCETYNSKTAICPEYCLPGCFCKKGWVKNSDGKCVPTSQCKPPTEECKGYNEVLVDCAKPKFCNTCGIKGNCKLTHCEKGCDCKPKYYRNETGICIPESQCPGSTPSCGEDEVYYKDCAPSCTGSCDTYGKEAVILCPLCRPGCWCKQGLVKDKNGKCIPFSKCDKPIEECGADEEYQECGTLCPRTCANLPYQIRCIAGCKKGCFCKEGLVRNDDDVCVKPEQCPNENCGAGEVYKKCGTFCPKTCENLHNPIICVAGCKKGCFCEEGLVRNSDNVCVKPEQCPNIRCGAGEEYRPCGSACPVTCSNLGKPQVCTDECVSGCFCQEGLVKDDNGRCVEPSECPLDECGANEEYTTCGTACPETCENKDKNIYCTLQCVPGCFCIKGFVRNARGKCINESQCEPNQCGVDEVYEECGTACPRTCASLYTKIRCIEKCVPGCFCRDDLVRHNGKCIDIRECQTQQCGANEEYKRCGTACPATCSNRHKPQVCTEQCVTGCFCKEGFVKNDNGECVVPSKCPSKTCGENEQYSNCGPCGRTCENKDKEISCTQDCRTGCFCKSGYVRNKEKKCVRPDQCPPACNGHNEAYVDCVKPKSCNTCEIRGNCKLKKCDKGCDCKPDFYRNSSGICIPESQCPVVSEGFDCDKGAETGPCKAHMPRYYFDQKSGTCKSFIYGGCRGNKNNFLTEKECHKRCGGDTGRPDCGIAPETGPCLALIPRFYYDKNSKECKSFTYGGCQGNSNNFESKDDCYKKCGSTSDQSDCDKGYDSGPCRGHMPRFYYDHHDGKCKYFVYGGCGGNKNNFKTKEECNKTCGGRCGVDEEYKTCGTACPDRCSNIGKPVNCTRQCVEGCFCKKGLVRNDTGKCVKPDKCHIGKCGVDEEYKRCGTACPGTCRNLNIKISCINKCVEGCFCKEGLVRNDEGECVNPSECPMKECGVNEKYSTCGSACPVTCANKDTDIICTLQCVIGCFCKKGYVRNAEGKCIRPDQCPSDKCTGFNEALVDCAKPKWCNTCQIKGNCKLTQCHKGCDCKPHYYRNESGVCIPESQCPGFCQLNEEYSDCVNPCNTCEIRGNCNFLVCNKGCDCKEGYYRNVFGMCIPAETCPITNQCGEDEVYNECGTACPRTCKNLNVKIACIAVCKKGCFCRDDLVRNDDGKCVDPSECPKGECGVGEVYKECGTACPRTCKNLNAKFKCTAVCKKGCFCIDGLVRNDDGKCVDPSECPNEECDGYNEAFVDCAKPKWCNTCQIKGNCKLTNCEEGCDCRPNYYRNGTGTCIPEAQCPNFCPLNEQYSECVVPCNTCEIRGMCNFLVCNKGCDCKKGYYRDINGNCILAETCPIIDPPKRVCGVDEEYYNCTPDCKNTCEKYNKPNVACPKICRKGCFCKTGLVKRKDGKCVRPTDCDNPPVLPSEKCGHREQYYDCIPNCHNTCETYNKTDIVCTQICRQGCFCREGYVLRKDNKCVRPAECHLAPERCGENEQYYTCGPCIRTCDNKDEAIFCTQDCSRTGCLCKKGYVRNDENKCVLPEQCPSEPPTCGRHEKYYSCMPNCRNTCETYNKTNILCSHLCRPGCFCSEGYVLRKDKKCVRPAKCNLPTERCGENEQYHTCGPCIRTCENKDEEIFCTQDCSRTGCLCKEGYVRNDENKCVLPEQCPSDQCGKDEVYKECGTACTRTCKNLNIKMDCIDICIKGCFCKDGLVRNDDGKCVEPSECPKEPTPSCPKDQQYYPCIPTCNRSCMTYNSTDAYCPKECIKGCFCKEGLVMNKDGGCVAPEDCPPSCDFTQQYYDCMPDCKNRCNPSKFCNRLCRPGCFCRADLVLREDNMCVRRELCSDDTSVTPPTEQHKCGPKKEYYDCYSPCNNSCESYGNDQVACPAVCETGCFCKKGLLVDEDGRCVTPAECGAKEETSEDTELLEGGEEDGLWTGGEESEPRASRETRQLNSRTAYNLGRNLYPIYGSRSCDYNQQYYTCMPDCQNRCNRPKFCTRVCRPGCFCRQGLLLRGDGMCVRRGLCRGDTSVTPPPQVQCGYNKEYYNCYSRCRNSCESYGKEQLVCPARCERGCFCKRGLLTDSAGRCVTPAECEGCGTNEEVVSCAKPKACNTCNIRGNCDLTNCTRGCDCKPGYYRDEVRVCIPESECPQYEDPEDECGLNEEYSECGFACPVTCKNYDRTILCTLQCKLGCFCKEGFVRNDEGACILPRECPPVRRRNPPRGVIDPRRPSLALKAKPAEWVAQEASSDESGLDELAGDDGRERESSRHSQWTVYQDDGNAEEVEFSERRVLSGSRTGTSTQEGFFADYSESTEDESGKSDEYMDWEEEFEKVY